MKRMKKLLSFVLAMMLVLAMGLPVMAAGNGEITINGALEGQTYSIYKIFDLESYNNEEGKEAYSYKVTDPWKAFIAGDGKDYVTVDENGYITWIGEATADRAQAFAKLALAYAKANDIAATDTKTPEKDATSVSFTGLDLGYYLVDSTTGALCSLDTTQPNVTMTEKNDEPTLEKKIKEGEELVDENTASIGDTVTFQVTIDVKDGAENYVMHDKMSAGLTFDGVNSIKVLLNEEVVSAANYTTTAPGTETDERCTFEVKFENSFLAGLSSDDTLIVTYTATVNKDAVIAGAGNPNDAKLDYGDGNETEWDTTKTYVYEFDVDKFTIRDGVRTQLAGAKFTLSVNADGTAPIAFTQVEGKTTYKVDKDSEDTVITTDGTGKFKLSGLAAGTYYLTETEPPAGYNKLAAPLEVVIAEEKNETTNERTGKFTINGVEGGIVEVENKTGAELPSTGGIGTTIFYVLGGILVVGAGIMLVVKKRMSSEK